MRVLRHAIDMTDYYCIGKRVQNPIYVQYWQSNSDSAFNRSRQPCGADENRVFVLLECMYVSWRLYTVYRTLRYWYMTLRPCSIHANWFNVLILLNLCRHDRLCNDCICLPRTQSEYSLLSVRCLWSRIDQVFVLSIVIVFRRETVPIRVIDSALWPSYILTV